MTEPCGVLWNRFLMILCLEMVEFVGKKNCGRLWSKTKSRQCRLWRFHCCSSPTKSLTPLSCCRDRSMQTAMFRRPQRFHQLRQTDQVIDVPVMLVVQIPRVRVVAETAEIPQLPFVKKIGVIPETAEIRQLLSDVRGVLYRTSELTLSSTI